jgi:gamma-glutamyltranspeptidase / glutathione hydrolase
VLRQTLRCGREAVSSGHYLATVAGIEILANGGNAVDAGVAAGLALGVVESNYVSIAGVAPIIVRMADARVPVTIAGVGTWPSQASCDLFRDRFGGDIPPGVMRTVVPAAPAAWIEALRRFGTMSFAEVAQAAIGFARDGMAVYELFRDTIAAAAQQMAAWPSSAALYLSGGAAPAVGTLFRHAELSATLQFMADEERAATAHGRAAGLAAARDAFYRGDIARQLVAFMQREGGLLELGDLAGFHVEVDDAVGISFGTIEVFGCGPWCQGPMLLQALKIVEAAGLEGMAHNSAAYLHVVAEALRLAAWDRERFYGDPRFVEVPLGWLLSEAHARGLAGRIRRDAALPQWPGNTGARHFDTDTSFVSVVDRFGNAFAATPSDGCTASPVIPGLGFVASPRGNQSRTDPAHPSAIVAGKRPRLTPNPAIAMREGEFVMPFGTPGHDTQGQVMLQVLLNLQHFRLTPQAAVDAPRIATLDFPSSAAPHAVRPGLLFIEEEIGAAAIDTLRALGHDARPWPQAGPDYIENLSAACLVHRDIASGVISAAADHRRPAHAVGR